MSSYSSNIRKSRPSSSYARPRSLYSSPSRVGSMYSSLSLSTPYLNSSSYSSSIPSYSPSSYGGTASGYGSLTLTPSSPSYSGGYSGRTISSSPSRQHHSRANSLKRSYQKPLSRFDSSSSLASNKSYGSEGYVSGGDNKASQISRLGSVSSQDSKLSSATTSPVPCMENGEINYKALYEEVVVDNERLRRQLQKTEEDLLEAKITIEKQSTNTNKNTLSEIEKRERRAMERKLSEMEEELKQLQKLKAENERLRTENRALTRVVSKLTHT